MSYQRSSIEFRWQPTKTTRDGILVEYLKTSPLLSARQQIIQTTRMCWLPIALWESGDFEKETIERLAKRSIYELYQQIERIARTVNLTIDLEFNQSVSLINPEDEAIEASLETHEIEDFEMS
jgi:hypothetical protein